MTEAARISVGALLRLLLRPIARLCIRRSIKVPEAVEALKLVFLEVAREEISRKGSDATASRLHVMTGIHRKFIPGLLEAVDAAPVSEKNLMSRILGHWQTGKRFTTKRGIPRFLECEGAESEFSDLVSSVSRDLNAYAVLFELERVGLVRRRGGRVELVKDIHLTNRNYHSGIGIASRDIDALLLSVEENLGSPEPRHLHLATEFDNIPASDLSALRRWILEEGSRFHSTLRAKLGSLDRDANPGGSEGSGRARVRIGTFGYSEILEDPLGETK